MQTRCAWLTLLCSLLFLSNVLSLQCSPTEYAWPAVSAKFCCKMCEPGKYMNGRPDDSCGARCDICSGELYSDSYNIDMECKRCDECNNLTAEYESHCNGTHNAVCRCKAGYRCKDDTHCTECVPVPHTTAEPSTTTDPMVPWLLVVALLGSVFALFFIKKIKPFLRWIRTKRVLHCPEDDEVSKPVQEVCGKCDQPIDP